MFYHLTETWIRMTYKDGDKYANACNRNERNVVIFIFCNSEHVSLFFRVQIHLWLLLRLNIQIVCFIFQIWAEFISASGRTLRRKTFELFHLPFKLFFSLVRYSAWSRRTMSVTKAAPTCFSYLRPRCVTQMRPNVHLRRTRKQTTAQRRNHLDWDSYQ